MIGAAVTFVLLAATACTAAAPVPDQGVVDELDISYDEGRVFGVLEGVPLDEVVAALGRRARVEFRGELREWRLVHVRFDGTRFRDAVDRLVGDQNFTIAYDAAGHPYRVELWSMPGRTTIARVRPGHELERLVAQYPPLPLPPLLVKTFRVPTARLAWLIRRGVRNNDAAVRLAATTLFVRIVDTDAALRAAMQRSDDQALANLLRSWAGNGVEHLLGALATDAHDPLLRSKVRRVLDRLRRTERGRRVVVVSNGLTRAERG